MLLWLLSFFLAIPGTILGALLTISVVLAPVGIPLIAASCYPCACVTIWIAHRKAHNYGNGQPSADKLEA